MKMKMKIMLVRVIHDGLGSGWKNVIGLICMKLILRVIMCCLCRMEVVMIIYGYYIALYMILDLSRCHFLSSILFIIKNISFFYSSI